MLLLSTASFFSKLTFSKKYLRNTTVSECQTVWVQIRTDKIVGPDLGPHCLQMLSASDKNSL